MNKAELRFLVIGVIAVLILIFTFAFGNTSAHRAGDGDDPVFVPTPTTKCQASESGTICLWGN